MDDPYKILGVGRDATAEQIKSAYRKLARKHHPDVNPGDAKAEETFKKVTAAHDLLSDPAKKARFDAGEIDASGAERPRQSYRAGTGSPFGESFHFGDNAEDIFSELLRRRSRGRTKSGAFFGEEDLAVRGSDAQYSLKIGFIEAAIGTTKRITMPAGRSLDVKIPPGTEDGAILRLKGQGNPGRAGGTDGDALIEIGVEAHPFFTRQGHDVLLNLPVTLSEAVLGAKVTVPTVDGKVTMSIPAGSNSGTVLRLKAKGIPSGRHRGDQLITLQVMLPERSDAELEAFLRQWSARHPYEVRGKLA